MAQANTNVNQALYPNRQASLVEVVDVTANDIDKDITVTAGKIWQILSVFCNYQPNNQAGNRLLRLLLKDASANIIGISTASAVAIADADEDFHWVPGTGFVTHETVATEHWMPLPGPRFWPAGYVATIGAVSGGDAGDDSLVRLLVLEYDD